MNTIKITAHQVISAVAVYDQSRGREVVRPKQFYFDLREKLKAGAETDFEKDVLNLAHKLASTRFPDAVEPTTPKEKLLYVLKDRHGGVSTSELLKETTIYNTVARATLKQLVEENLIHSYQIVTQKTCFTFYRLNEFKDCKKKTQVKGEDRSDEILAVLSERQFVNLADIREKIKGCTKAALRVMLMRLEKKGVVEINRKNVKHGYRIKAKVEVAA